MIIQCANCSQQFAPGFELCPRCQSDDILVGTELPSGIVVYGPRSAGVMVTGKQHEIVKGSFLRQHVKREWSRSREQLEFVERVFDRVDRMYHETYYDPDSGKVVFEKHAPIDDQSVHGRRSRS